MASPQNHVLQIGDSWPLGNDKVLTVVVSQGPDLDNLEPVDLSDAAVLTEFAETPGGDSIVVPETEILDQVADPGAFTYRIPSSETDSLGPRTYHYRIRLRWEDTDSELTVLYGKFRATYDG